MEMYTIENKEELVLLSGAGAVQGRCWSYERLCKSKVVAGRGHSRLWETAHTNPVLSHHCAVVHIGVSTLRASLEREDLVRSVEACTCTHTHTYTPRSWWDPR